MSSTKVVPISTPPPSNVLPPIKPLSAPVKKKVPSFTQKEQQEDENDQSASATIARAEERMESKNTIFWRVSSFIGLTAWCVVFLPVLKSSWTSSIYYSLSARDLLTTTDITINIKSCRLNIQTYKYNTSYPVDNVIGVRSSILFPPFFYSVGVGYKKLNVDLQDLQTKQITAELGVSSRFAPYLPCHITLSIPEHANLQNIDLHIESRGTNPSYVTFHKFESKGVLQTSAEQIRSIPMFKSLRMNGPVVYFQSSHKYSSPATDINININSGGVNISSADNSNVVNITTTSADIEILSSSDTLYVDELAQPYHYYVIGGACIGQKGCYEGDGSGGSSGSSSGSSSQRNSSNTTAGGLPSLYDVALYPTPSDHSNSFKVVPPSQVHLTLASTTGTIYVGAINRVLLHNRQFMVTSGATRPMFEISSKKKLERVKQFINTAPDEDAIIIMDVVSSGAVEHTKWLYSTKEPYIQIEPAWMWIMSLGVLSARQQQLVIHVACGHWPFMDSRRDVGVGQFQNSSRNNNNVIIVNEDVQAATTRDKDELDGLGLNDGNAAGPVLVTANTYELYQLLATTMQVPLLADVLSFKNSNFAFTFQAHGPSSYRVREIDWRLNRFLYPAVLLSLIAAAIGSLFINYSVMFMGGKEYMLSIVKKKNLRKTVKLLKKIQAEIRDKDEEDDEKKIASANALKKILVTSSTATSATETMICYVPHKTRALIVGDELTISGHNGNAADLAMNQLYTVKTVIDATHAVLIGSGLATGSYSSGNIIATFTKIEHSELLETAVVAVVEAAKGNKSDLFNANVPKRLMSLLDVDDLSEFLPETTVLGGVLFKSNSDPVVVEETKKETKEDNQVHESNKNSSSSDGEKRTCCSFCGGCCEATDTDFPSPFLLPVIAIQELMEAESHSLFDFIKSKNTFELDEEHKWTTKGRTSIERFNTIYTDWCDRNERRKVSVVESTSVLKSLGITISSELEQCVTGIKYKNKSERVDINSKQGKGKFNLYYNAAKAIEQECLDKKISIVTARFKIGELAYFHWMAECMEVTGDEVNFISFDDLFQHCNSFIDKSTKIKNDISIADVRKSVSNLGKASSSISSPKQETTQDKQKIETEINKLHETVKLLPLYFARDKKNFGEAAWNSLTRCDIYVLNNVEVCTMKELTNRQNEELESGYRLPWEKNKDELTGEFTVKLEKWRIDFSKSFRTLSKAFRFYRWCFIESLLYVAATSFLCLVVPLPLCCLILYHQHLYKATTAASDQFVPELMITHPLDIDHWRLKDMNVENQVILIAALPYYFLSCIKLLFFYMNIKGTMRRCIRKIWIIYTGLWSVLLVGWFIVIMLWIVLGAVLNPVAVLAHSVAVGSSCSLLRRMYKLGMGKMKKMRVLLRTIIDKKLMKVLNKPNGILVRKLKAQCIKELQVMGENVGDGTIPRVNVAAVGFRNVKDLMNSKLPLTPAKAFQLLDLNGDKVLTFNEFNSLLENMNLNISEERAYRIFASVDKGQSKTNPTITYSEFCIAWQQLIGVIVDDALANTGLSRREILIGLLAASCVLSVLFSFLFLSVSAFGGAGSFGSTVRSAMALAASKLGSAVGEKSDPDAAFINNAAEKSLRVFLGSNSEQNSESSVGKDEGDEKEDGHGGGDKISSIGSVSRGTTEKKPHAD